ncbi:hypothetical protein niasHT_037351 [Heterodera trifolii]|uniref:PAS domain-containing protein n=1 Tax=Heterodera trifolii TaxID=157864 RepID=A0ABD2J4T9_9BILA
MSEKISFKHKNKAPAERSAKVPKMDAEKRLINTGETNFGKVAYSEGNRRVKEKHAFIELSSLVPLPPPIRDQLDKTATLRTTIAFLKIRRLFGTFISFRASENGQCVGTSSQNDQSAEFESDEKRRHWPNYGGFYGMRTTTTTTNCNQEQMMMHQFSYNLFQAMDGFVIVLDCEGKVIYTSETVAVHLGLAQVELAGISLAEFVHPDDATLLHNQLALNLPANALLVLQPELRFTLRFRCTPGRRAMMGCNGIGMQPGYKPIHFVGTLHADDDGRFLGYGQPSVPYGLNELRLCSSMFMFRATPALQLIFVDNRFTEVTELMPTFLLNQSLFSLIHPADVQQLSEVQQTALRGGQALSAFLRLLNGRGGWHWIQCRLCTTNTSRMPTLSKMVVGVCTLISEAEQFDKVMDVLQMHNINNTTNSLSSGTDCAAGGVLGFYSNKFYVNGKTVEDEAHQH